MVNFDRPSTFRFWDTEDGIRHWRAGWTVADFSVATTYAFNGDMAAAFEGYLVFPQHFSIKLTAAAGGVLISPLIYCMPNTTNEVALSAQISAYATEYITWSLEGIPVQVGGNPDGYFSGVSCTGYAATDDMNLWVSGHAKKIVEKVE